MTGMPDWPGNMSLETWRKYEGRVVSIKHKVEFTAVDRWYEYALLKFEDGPEVRMPDWLLTYYKFEPTHLGLFCPNHAGERLRDASRAIRKHCKAREKEIEQYKALHKKYGGKV